MGAPVQTKQDEQYVWMMLLIPTIHQVGDPLDLQHVWFSSPDQHCTPP
uniref:Uncharacterized protein n=1 Tax=Nelumbo nucifera TaxID=4432 RepID=A0A822YBM5_NELNU|nr:TPA_asm: hypothetical protein HUJ06_031458 [Nelumbo nucifera]